MCGQHLNTADDLTGYPVFPDGTKSLLCKFLSKEVWNQLKGVTDHTPSGSFSFKEAIFSGCKNTDSGIGVYAGTANSYNAFAPLFDRVIEDYHGHGPSDIH